VAHKEVNHVISRSSESFLFRNRQLIVSGCVILIGSSFVSCTTRESEIPLSKNEFDVIVYGDTAGTAGFIDGLANMGKKAANLSVVVISPEPYSQAPLANGQSIEDMFEADVDASGSYKRFRDEIIKYYAAKGINANSNGRLLYEPEAAAIILAKMQDKNFVKKIVGELISAGEEDGKKIAIVKLPDGQTVKITGNMMVLDTSPEADMARMLGASYRVGELETVYNDSLGKTPPFPTKKNEYSTSPEAMSSLFTLQVYDELAPKVTDMPEYDGSDYDPTKYKDINLKDFKKSWSMRYILPNNKRELNEYWSNYLNPENIYRFVFGTKEDREEIYSFMVSELMDKVRYLQENGYPNIGIANIPQYPYVRGDVRIIGETNYTRNDINNSIKKDPVTRIEYNGWDEHNPVDGPQNTQGCAYVYVPLGSMKVLSDQNVTDDIFVTAAVSSDKSAYDSAVRTEPVRMNLGEIAAFVATAARKRNIRVKDVTWEMVFQIAREMGVKI